MNMKFNQQNARTLHKALLCIADTYWVLGHWYIKCMLNGRSIADFNALAGFAQDTLGNTRAIFRYLEEEGGLPEHQLEFERTESAVHSMGVLDMAPKSWGDFVLTTFLAETAVWKDIQTMTFAGTCAPGVLLTRFGESLYYREMHLEGWMEAFTERERSDAAQVFPMRMRETLQWFSSAAVTREDAEFRQVSEVTAGERWLEKVGSTLKACIGAQAPQDSGQPVPNWSAAKRRPNRPIPLGLWEFMVPRSPEAEMARRPLEVSVTDNLDLFGRSA